MAKPIWRTLADKWRAGSAGVGRSPPAPAIPMPSDLRPRASPDPPGQAVITNVRKGPAPWTPNSILSSFRVDEADESWSRQIVAARALLAWSEWDLAEATEFDVSVRDIKHFERSGWASDRAAVAARLRAALEAGGVEFLVNGFYGTGVRRARPMLEARVPALPPEDANSRTLCIDGDYSIEMAFEYSYLRWPGGIYPVGEHYGNCKCAAINAQRGWCVTGGSGLVVSLFDSGLPRGREPVDPEKVVCYDVGYPADLGRSLWVYAIWRGAGEPDDSDVVSVAAAGLPGIYELDLRARTWTKVS